MFIYMYIFTNICVRMNKTESVYVWAEGQPHQVTKVKSKQRQTMETERP